MSHRRNVVAAVLFSATLGTGLATASQAAANPNRPPEPPPDDKAKPALLELRAQLMSAMRETVLQRMKVFRPLCDADGYPLVGNVATKGPMMQPSELCQEVRFAEGKEKRPE